MGVDESFVEPNTVVSIASVDIPLHIDSLSVKVNILSTLFTESMDYSQSGPTLMVGD